MMMGKETKAINAQDEAERATPTCNYDATASKTAGGII
jgi:hypothetical protein